MTTDVLISGGGPSGLYASYLLAKKGLKVLLIERGTIPNNKPCGGCLSARIKKVLWEFPYSRWVRKVRVNIQDTDCIDIEFGSPVAAMVDRRTFDAHIKDLALREGVKIMENAPLKGYTKKGNYFWVETAKGTVRSKHLILADGAHVKGKGFGVSISCKKRLEREPGFDAEIHIDLHSRGYGWVFQKEDHASMGYATFNRKFRKALELGMEKLNAMFPGKLIEPPRLYPLPYWSPSIKKRATERNGAILIGDRGFFMDALLGEGIYYSLLSAAAAAESIADGSGARGFRKRTKKLILRELLGAYMLSKILWGMPFVAEKAVARNARALIKAMGAVLRGEKTYMELVKEGLPLPKIYQD